MKLEIELDLNKIDYDAINRQISEKIADLNIKEEYDIESKIDRSISCHVKDEVDCSYNKYLEKYFFGDGTSAEGRNLIQSMTKEEIEKRTKQIIEDVFTNDYNEETLRELMLKFLPDVFASILFRRMESALFNKENDYYNQMYNMVRGQIDSTINSMRRY